MKEKIKEKVKVKSRQDNGKHFAPLPEYFVQSIKL